MLGIAWSAIDAGSSTSPPELAVFVHLSGLEGPKA
jgi:hypothetical protein